VKIKWTGEAEDAESSMALALSRGLKLYRATGEKFGSGKFATWIRSRPPDPGRSPVPQSPQILFPFFQTLAPFFCLCLCSSRPKTLNWNSLRRQGAFWNLTRTWNRAHNAFPF